MAEDVIDRVVSGGDDDAAAGGKGGRLMPMLMGTAVVAISAVLGVAASVFLAGPPAEATAESAKPPIKLPESAAENYAYYEFEPITVNANVPQRNRYIRATVTMAFHPKVLAEIQKDLDAKKPELRSWLTGYLSGLTLEDVGGPKNLARICGEIQDEMNHKLWPDQGQVIHHVLMKEFAVQ